MSWFKKVRNAQPEFVTISTEFDAWWRKLLKFHLNRNNGIYEGSVVLQSSYI